MTKEELEKEAEVISYIVGGVLALIICLVIHYWNKENKE